MNEHFTIGTCSTRSYTIPASLLLPPMPAPVQSVKTPIRGRKQAKKGRVERTRNGGTWTDAQFRGKIRSALRRIDRFWIPKQQALKLVRFSWPGPRGRKWGYPCAHCGGKFIRKNVEVDHIIPCGSLKTLEDIVAFIQRMFPEDPAAYQVLCLKCHKEKTLLDNMPVCPVCNCKKKLTGAGCCDDCYL